MAKYRKKPAVTEVDAVQFLPSKTGPFDVPVGMKLWPNERGATPRNMSWGYIDTPDGTFHVMAGDWILTDSVGDHYYLSNEAFEYLYEPA